MGYYFSKTEQLLDRLIVVSFDVNIELTKNVGAVTTFINVVTDYGLYIGSVFTGSLLYADDIALLACSCLVLQKPINVRMAYGIQWDISFNPVKVR